MTKIFFAIIKEEEEEEEKTNDETNLEIPRTPSTPPRVRDDSVSAAMSQLKTTLCHRDLHQLSGF